jgi:hypothetical protein
MTSRLGTKHDTMDLSKVPRLHHQHQDLQHDDQVAGIAEHERNGNDGNDGNDEKNKNEPQPTPQQAQPGVLANGVKVRQIVSRGSRTPTLILNKPIQNNPPTTPEKTDKTEKTEKTDKIYEISQSSPHQSSSPQSQLQTTPPQPLNSSLNITQDDFSPSPMISATSPPHSHSNLNISHNYLPDDSINSDYNEKELIQLNTQLNELQTARENLPEKLSNFSKKLQKQKIETLKAQQGVRSRLQEAQEQLQQMELLTKKSAFPASFTEFLLQSTESLSTILTRTDFFIEKTTKSIEKTSNLNFFQNNNNNNNNNNNTNTSFNWNNNEDAFDVSTPTKKDHKTDLLNDSVGFNDSNNDVSFDFNLISSTGFSPNRHRTSPSITQPRQEPNNTTVSPFSIPSSPQQENKNAQNAQNAPKVRQIQNRFRGKTNNDDKTEGNKVDPNVNNNFQNYLDEETEEEKEQRHQMALFLAKLHGEDTPSLSLSNPTTTSYPDDFDDDESSCFVPKKPEPKIELKIEHKYEDDFDDDESACFKPIPPPTPPANRVNLFESQYDTNSYNNSQYEDDFEDDDCVITHNAPPTQFQLLFNPNPAQITRVEVDELLQRAEDYVQYDFTIKNKNIELSDSSDEENINNGADSQSNPTKLINSDRNTPVVDPGTNAMSFINQFTSTGSDFDSDNDDDDDGDGDGDDDESRNDHKKHDNSNEIINSKRRVRFSEPKVRKKTLKLQVLPFAPQDYEQYEYIRDYNNDKDTHIDVEVQGDTYNDTLDIDGEYNQDSTLFYQLETRANTANNTTPTVSAFDANRQWETSGRGYSYKRGSEGSSDEEYSGTYQPYKIEPPPPNDEENFDPEAHKRYLTSLLYGGNKDDESVDEKKNDADFSALFLEDDSAAGLYNQDDSHGIVDDDL